MKKKFNILNKLDLTKSFLLIIFPFLIKYVKTFSNNNLAFISKYKMNYLKNIDNLNLKQKMFLIKFNYRTIQYLKVDKKIKLSAINLNPNSIFYIKNPSEKMQLEAVKKSADLIYGIRNPKDKVIKFIIDNHYKLLNYIWKIPKKFEKDLLGIIIHNNPYLVTKIKNPSEELKIEAIRSDPFIIDLFKNPSMNLIEEAIIQNSGVIKNLNKKIINTKLLELAIDNSTCSFIDYDELNDFLTFIVINFNKKLTNKLKEKIILIDPFLIEFIKNSSEELKLLAARTNGLVLEVINKKSAAIKITAIKQNGLSIKFINNPSKKLQELAINNNHNAINYIKNPNKKLKSKSFRLEFDNLLKNNYN